MPTTILGTTYSDALLEAIARAPAQRAILETLELHHSSFTTPARIVADKQDLLATLEDDAPVDAGEQVLFKALGLRLQLPDESDDAKSSRARLAIDGVSRYFTELLDGAMDTLEPVTVILREYASDDTSGPCRLPPLQLQLRLVDLTPTVAETEAGYSDPVNKAFPAKDYQAREYPGLTAQ